MPVDGGFELREAVEQRLSRTPIVFIEPVGSDFLRVGQRQSLRPIIDAFGLGPSRLAQAALQVI